MLNRLFVGGLSWDTNDEGLRAAFSRFGEVSEAKVVLDRETNRSRGFGFVTMSSADACQAAMRDLDGSTLDGRSIRVNEANDRGRGGGDRGNGGGGRGTGFSGSRNRY
ncbi:MAG: RNA-binding protein [Myxococcales bacterium]|nr:RNA-binding protein [Myxococcales bacterium]